MERKTTKGERTRTKIIKAGIEVFARHGFAEASFAVIAKRAGTRPTVIVHHFGNKYALYEKCIEFVLSHFAEMISGDSHFNDDAVTRLEKSFTNNLRLAREFPEEVKIILFLYFTASHDRKFLAIYTALVKRLRERYQGILLSGLRENVFVLNVPVEDMAEIIHEQIIGLIVNYIAVSKREDEELRIRRKWAAFLKSMLGVEIKAPDAA